MTGPMRSDSTTTVASPIVELKFPGGQSSALPGVSPIRSFPNRERERETHTHTDRQTETDRGTDRDRETDRQRQTEKQTEKDRDRERQRDRQRERALSVYYSHERFLPSSIIFL